LTNSITYYHFKFANYANAGIDNSGHNITGVPQTVVVSGLRLDFFYNIYFYTQHNYTSSIPLNDANTAYASYFDLVQLKAGWKTSLTTRLKLEFTLGIDNLLNQKYSLGNDLNAVGGRYYNAAAPRNYYGGVRVWF
jgi:iron complex outermembrane receptor protein